MDDTKKDDKLNNLIHKLYNSGGYFTKYGKDVWITVIIFAVVIYTIIYYNILNNIKPIQDDWVNKRCSPAVLPFAGIINKPDDQTNLEYTASNFNYCIQGIVSSVTQYAFLPIYYAINTITSVFTDVVNAINSVRTLLSSVTNSVVEEGEEINNRILNIMQPIVNSLKKIQSIGGKMNGALLGGLYTAYGGFITTQSAALFMYELVINLMYIIVAFIITCFSVGWLFPPMLATGMSAAAFLTILMIPFIIVAVIMNELLNAANLEPPPGVPSYCFTKDTKLMTKQGSVNINNIKLGTKLNDGSIVTATMKTSAENIKLYSINDIIVSNKHKIFYKKWINVEDHPESKEVLNHNEKYLYCIGTDSKIIKIGNNIFSDWDEVDDEDINELVLNKRCKINEKSSRFDIHRLLDTGIDGESEIKLSNGKKVPIKDVQIGDEIEKNNKVKGIVKIKSDDTEEYGELFFKNISILKCSKNTEIRNINLGEDKEISWKPIMPPNISYHLVCDKGTFKINNLIIGNYGRGIDRYLSIENLNNSKL